MNALVSARNVTKIYNKNQLPGLNKVSFDILAGEFVGIMGPLDRKNNFIKYFIHYRHTYRGRCFYKWD